MSQQTRHHIFHWIGVVLFVSCFTGVLLFGRSIFSSEQSAAAVDTLFATNAAQGGMAAVKLGELAQEKAGREAVKSFGKRMVNDHSKAGEKLRATAQSENINLPTELKPADQAAYDRLSKLSGGEFDRAYMQMMVKDHAEDVAEFSRESTSGSNLALKDFATQILPTLKDHLKEARQVAANRKASL